MQAYEDFIAVAEHLIERGVTSPKRLGIQGGSNGGLLMGNMLTMRPDLWGAVLCQVCAAVCSVGLFGTVASVAAVRSAKLQMLAGPAAGHVPLHAFAGWRLVDRALACPWLLFFVYIYLK